MDPALSSVAPEVSFPLDEAAREVEFANRSLVTFPIGLGAFWAVLFVVIGIGTLTHPSPFHLFALGAVGLAGLGGTLCFRRLLVRLFPARRVPLSLELSADRIRLRYQSGNPLELRWTDPYLSFSVSRLEKPNGVSWSSFFPPGEGRGLRIPTPAEVAIREVANARGLYRTDGGTDRGRRKIRWTLYSGSPIRGGMVSGS